MKLHIIHYQPEKYPILFQNKKSHPRPQDKVVTQTVSSDKRGRHTNGVVT